MNKHQYSIELQLGNIILQNMNARYLFLTNSITLFHFVLYEPFNSTEFDFTSCLANYEEKWTFETILK